jgi:signal transduction histidine kinase
VRRQFLRVYLGIALVLLTAALAMLFVVDREVRKVVDQRLEEMVTSWARSIRFRLLRAGANPERRANMLERLNENAPFAIRLISKEELDLQEYDIERLAAGDPILINTDEGRIAYIKFDAAETLVLGPLQRDQLSPRGPGPHRGSRGSRPWESKPPRPDGPFPWAGKFPFQGAYFLIGVLLFILLVIGGAVYLLLRPFERRIYALADVARDFGEGKWNSRARVERDDAIGALARSFDDMADRIETFIERQKELLRAVSHEFRTPLARLFFMVDDAQDAPTIEEKNRHIGRIEGSLQELNDLVEELLTFVRLDGQTEEKPAFETVDLGATVDDVAAVISDLRSDLSVNVECDDLSISAVPRLLRRAVLNLATNAARHASERVQISCQSAGDTVHIHVDDDGSGVPREAREKIFEPFIRLDESRTAESGGVGLGLAIVQRIAALHDGRVHVDDSPLGGARFTLDFPN